MDWINFPLYALITLFLLVLGTVLIYIQPKAKLISEILIVLSVIVMGAFILNLWIHLQRPPLRTLGETRLWYAFFLPLIGYITYKRWGYLWFMAYSNAMALLFLLLNYLHPELHDKTLMPALQSAWFAPHVIVYIFGYALLAASTLAALKGLYLHYYKVFDHTILKVSDNLVYIGFSFLTLGLLFGALWAKEAWGHYWTWDPKETWAFLTWLGYLVYIHFRHNHPKKVVVPLWILSLAFVILIIAWFGINYLPSAQNSVHVYSNQ
jgi:ABC-type transport system involved in cytochrome c biogenesis permease subunit